METEEIMDTPYDMFLKLKELEEREAHTTECLEGYLYDEFGNYSEYGHRYEDVEYIEELSWSLDSTQKEINKIIQKMEKYLHLKKDIEAGYVKMAMHPKRIYDYLVTHNIDFIDLDIDSLLENGI